MGYEWGLVRDVGVCLSLFLQWTLVSVAIDTLTDSSVSLRRGTSLYLAITTLGVNLASLFASFMATGRKSEERRNPETLVGVWFEVLTSVQGWGTAFCAARLWSLDPSHDFFTHSFTYQLADSIFEMTSVQAGVGFVNATPLTTTAEKIVSWFTVTVGGILTVNFFLAAVILGRRAWWLQPPMGEPEESTGLLAAAPQLQLQQQQFQPAQQTTAALPMAATLVPLLPGKRGPSVRSSGV